MYIPTINFYKNNIILKILFFKVISQGNATRSNLIIIKLLNNIETLFKTKHPLYIVETSLYNMIIPVKKVVIISNTSNSYKLYGITLNLSIKIALTYIIKFIKFNYKFPIETKLLKEIIKLYNKQGDIYQTNLKILSNILTKFN